MAKKVKGPQMASPTLGKVKKAKRSAAKVARKVTKQVKKGK